jgi:gamma-glutamyltranspeptidase/glutathione hydrolase
MQYEQYPFPSRRSNVIARQGMVATSQPLAAQAGLAVLQQGGNAIDAAIATVATLCVVEPCSTGIGGDAFALIWSAADRTLYGINASGPASRLLDAEAIRARGHHQMPETGGIPVTVPGSLRGWQLALERFGTRGLDTVLQQAIGYARDGFPVSQQIARSWQRSTAKMSAHPDSARVWLPGGRAPHAGELFRNPEFARTLTRLADDGYGAFYEGAVARQIVATVREAGGWMSEEDLADYRAEWVQPLALPWRDGVSFHQIPPNGQGLTTLLALKLVESADIPALGHGSAELTHLLIEATKLAFADAQAFIADPACGSVPVAGLLSPDYIATRRALIGPTAAAPQAGTPPRHGDTVYLTVADGEGNMVSWIQSLYMGFGSGLTAGTTGVQLQNRGANFSLEPGHPNEAAPGKRPYNTIIPGFITRHGEAWCSFGVMGGFMQPQGQLQVGLNLVAFGMDPQSALDAPRFNWLEGRRVGLELSAAPATRAGLMARGHEIVPERATGQLQFGGGQVIVRDPHSGVLIGGSEPRNDGAAVGW